MSCGNSTDDTCEAYCSKQLPQVTPELVQLQSPREGRHRPHRRTDLFQRTRNLRVAVKYRKYRRIWRPLAPFRELRFAILRGERDGKPERPHALLTSR
jgi:hypothetical protein